MGKDKVLEPVNEIKELIEESSKFISLSGFAAIMAGVYALVGTYIATQIITSGTCSIVALELMAVIASLALIAAAVTACILPYHKSKKTGQKFFSRLAYRALWNFSPPMLTGGVSYISTMMHEYYDVLALAMFLFYELALVNVSKFTYSSIVWLGYVFVHLGVVDCFWEGHSLLFWTIGLGGFHIFYGILLYLHHERKRSWMIEAFQYINKAFESKVRLGIMATLMVNKEADLNSLKEQLSLTDDDLASHIRSLEELRYIVCSKSFVGWKPRTIFQTALRGREAFKSHIEASEKSLKPK